MIVIIHIFCTCTIHIVDMDVCSSEVSHYCYCFVSCLRAVVYNVYPQRVVLFSTHIFIYYSYLLCECEERIEKDNFLEYTVCHFIQHFSVKYFYLSRLCTMLCIVCRVWSI